jgi:hypothetical protein
VTQVAPVDKNSLIRAIRSSGGKGWALAEVDDLLPRLDLLRNTGRYDQLLTTLKDANNKSNFLALLLEANFAYQFESQGFALAYEVKQNAQHGSSIDFLRVMPGADNVYFELRLLQQKQSLKESINEQLAKLGIYKVFMDGAREQGEIVRLQNTILGKVQDKAGRPIKFFSVEARTVNIVVIDATESLLEAIDVHDCLLATGGDVAVDEEHRRQVFGLFQEDRPEYPQRIHDLARRFSHIRATVHGVLFLFRARGTGVLAYRLEQYMLWNPTLMAEARARPIMTELSRAVPHRREQ